MSSALPEARVTIRPVERAEATAVLRLINEAFLVERRFIDGDRTDADDVAARFGRGQFLGAYVAETMVACIYVEVRGERGYFGMLAVDPVRQGEGLGRRLVAAAEDLCRTHGCSFMDIQVVNLRTELVPYYQALGYRETGTLPFADDAVGLLRQPCHFIRMSKPLR